MYERDPCGTIWTMSGINFSRTRCEYLPVRSSAAILAAQGPGKVILLITY